MSIQILQYEFLGPVNLDQWGPPMEKVVYLILGRDKDSFRIVYAGECEKTDEKAFFIDNSNFKCWVKQASSEKSLYLAILPLFDAAKEQRMHILEKIIAHYKPPCNDAHVPEPPAYKIASKRPAEPKTPCPCCGADMKVDQIFEKTTRIRCSECGISDTRLNS